LLIGPNVHAGYVRQIINLTQTTSGSYLLMSSLDISRRNLALRGRKVFHQVADMAEYAREEINAVGGYYAFGKELCNGNSVFDFDTTKLSVHTLDIGLAGIEVYDILRDEYDIQINIILFIPEFCKKSIFTKNRISPKNECIFPENPRNFSLHRQKTALFFGKCSVFFHFFRKNIDFRVSTSRKRITFAPEEQNTLCRGSKSESLRCCFFRF